MRLFIVSADSKVQLLHQGGTGNFEALLNEEAVVTGQLTLINTHLPKTVINRGIFNTSTKKAFINENQIYSYFEANNCLFNGPFRGISSITLYEKGNLNYNTILP